jgi:hypothetical protein
MWFLSAGINHVLIAAWLAPIPLLVVLLDLPAARAAMAAFVALAIGALSFVVAYRSLPAVLLASTVLLLAIAPISPGGTFYSRSGDWVPWLCVSAVVACIATNWRNRRLTS